jgi:hypothetical protein
VVFPRDFFAHFKKKAEEKTDPVHKPQFPLPAFAQHKKTTEEAFSAEILALSKEPHSKFKPQKPKDS